MESFETDLMSDEAAHKFSTWFDLVIGTDCYRHGSVNKRYFVCLELTDNDVWLIHAFLKNN